MNMLQKFCQDILLDSVYSGVDPTPFECHIVSLMAPSLSTEYLHQATSNITFGLYIGKLSAIWKGVLETVKNELRRREEFCDFNICDLIDLAWNLGHVTVDYDPIRGDSWRVDIQRKPAVVLF